MSSRSSSLRALTQNDLNRTASETTVCSKKKTESCESIICFKKQKTSFCCLSSTHSFVTFSSIIIKHACISFIFSVSLSSLDQTSQVSKKKTERSRVEKTSEVSKKRCERFRVEKTSEVSKKKMKNLELKRRQKSRNIKMKDFENSKKL